MHRSIINRMNSESMNFSLRNILYPAEPSLSILLGYRQHLLKKKCAIDNCYWGWQINWNRNLFINITRQLYCDSVWLLLELCNFSLYFVLICDDWQIMCRWNWGDDISLVELSERNINMLKLWKWICNLCFTDILYFGYLRW